MGIPHLIYYSFSPVEINKSESFGNFTTHFLHCCEEHDILRCLDYYAIFFLVLLLLKIDLIQICVCFKELDESMIHRYHEVLPFYLNLQELNIFRLSLKANCQDIILDSFDVLFVKLFCFSSLQSFLLTWNIRFELFLKQNRFYVCACIYDGIQFTSVNMFATFINPPFNNIAWLHTKRRCDYLL